MPHAESQPLEATHRYPPRSRRAYIAAAVFGAAMALAALALQLSPAVDLVERGQLVVFAVGFGLVLIHAVDAVRTMSREVRLAPAGVASGRDALVPWAEVALVAIRPLRQRMDVFDAAGRRFLSLRPELESFAAVQDIILAHMQPRPCVPPCTIPLLTPFAGAPIAIVSALLAVWFGPQRGPVPAALCASLSAVLGLVHLARRRRIQVASDRLVVKQGWRRVAVPYRDVTAVHVQARPRPHGGAVHFLVLERDRGDAIVIAGFRHGYKHAYQSVEQAWRAGRCAG